jgi:hypothetical protein
MILSSQIRRARTIKGTGARKPSSPETEPNFYTMPFLVKCIEEGGQTNSKLVVMNPDPLVADSMSTTRRIAPVYTPYVCGNYVKNPLVECTQTGNGPKQLSPFEPIPIFESTVSMHGCPERTTSTPTAAPAVRDEGRYGNQRQEESSTSQSYQDEADFIAEIGELRHFFAS